ncbi:MAG: ribosome biogenesis GTPase YlqF [Christensenellales bacterium]|jgi:ribosome biogenesis GTPase A
MPEINWYPGHMARSRRLLSEQLRAVDAVVELCDARAPLATRNPDLEKLTRSKSRLIVLNKADLADDAATAKWLSYFRAAGTPAMRFNSTGARAREVFSKLEEAVKPAMERAQRRGIRKTARIMVIGIPNVGKSTFINRINGAPIAKVADRPGVTRANQWIKITPYLELLDTPGMLPPKLDDQARARLLAYLGSVRDQILDTEELAAGLLAHLMGIAPADTRRRFKIADGEYAHAYDLVEAACAGRGWLIAGGRPDTDRAAALILDEFRAGRVGKITLEVPDA